MININTETWPEFILLKDEETQVNQSYDKAVEDFGAIHRAKVIVFIWRNESHNDTHFSYFVSLACQISYKFGYIQTRTYARKR
ncbi:hypothetical protein [Vibrio mytili]|uniref:Uncharacterized protein n=1 Tax=Vibrio mytili TaxID=50718 RepID=A0A0C3HST7_9VIBR|nr:hypothetical protein [Vibrio mytili]KIN11246.1 hypothetical protein SU60_08610 [Vibrio mytili]